MRTLFLAALCLILFCAGLFLGRLTASPDVGFQPGSLPGDDALEQAWENFLQSQRAALLLLRDSEFYGDDQERAEAYISLWQDIQVALAGERGEPGGDMLLGELPVSKPPGVPLTPNGMASMLEDAADSIYRRSGERLARTRQIFESAHNGIAVLESDSKLQTGLGYWDLDNDQALLIEIPSGRAGDTRLSMGNVWAMGIESLSADGDAAANLACTGETGCRGILSHRDPQLDGWLDTGGHRRGLLLLSWRSGMQPPLVKLVSFESLRNAAPAVRESNEAGQQENGTP